MTTALVNETVEPTDKSNPSTDKDMVIPTAIMVTIEIDLRILTIFAPSMKAGLVIEKIIIKAKIVIIVPYLYKKSNNSKPFFEGAFF
jgi:hypothetical protein